MRIRLLVTSAACLMAGCNKSEDKPQSALKTPPAKEERPTPVSKVPAQPANKEDVASLIPDAPKVPPPTEEDVAAFDAELAVMLKTAEPLLKEGAEALPAEQLAAIQKSWTALMQRRMKLMAGMNAEQKREAARKFGPAMKIAVALNNHRLKSMQERVRALRPPTVPAPGEAPPAPAPEHSAPATPPAPPPPAEPAPAPPQ